MDTSSFITGETTTIPAGRQAWSAFLSNFRMFQPPERRAETDQVQKSEQPGPVSAPKSGGSAKPKEGNIWPDDERRAALYEQYQKDRDLIPDTKKRETADVIEARAAKKYAAGIVQISHGEMQEARLDQEKRAVYRHDLVAYDATKDMTDRIHAQQGIGPKPPKVDQSAPGLKERHPDAGRTAYIDGTHGYEESDTFRGRIISSPLREESAGSVSTEQAKSLRHSWNQSANSGMFTPEQVEGIKKIKGEVPEYNRKDAKSIALDIAQDHHDLATYRNLPANAKYVRVKGEDGAYAQGLAVQEADGRYTKEGNWFSFDKENKPKERATYEGGMLSGEVVEFHGNGKPSRTTNYVAGKRHGEMVTYNEDGVVSSKVDFSGDQPVKTMNAADLKARHNQPSVSSGPTR